MVWRIEAHGAGAIVGGTPRRKQKRPLVAIAYGLREIDEKRARVKFERMLPIVWESHKGIC